MAFKRKEYHKEVNCLSCGYPLVGKFCANCGQKAFLHKDSFLHMVVHFAGDYFHYDSKFWRTIKTMALRPGLVTLDYINGKRVKYLNPIQLYIFITTIFFIVAFSDSLKEKNAGVRSFSEQQADSLRAISRTSMGLNTHGGGMRVGIGHFTPNESSLEAYDSTQKSLPPEQRDGFFLNLVRRKSYLHSGDLGEQLSHNFPKVFFLLLPLFALFLALLFRKKKMFYVDHLIFSIHFHSVLFAILLLNIILIKVWRNDTFETVLPLLVLVGIAVYLFVSVRKVYPSPAWKIIIKLLFLFFAYFISFIIAFFLLLSIIFLFF